jgi:hypothetical protein
MRNATVGAALALVCLGAHGQEITGRVLFASGESLRIAAGGKALPLRRGDAVYQGDTLRTGPQAHLQLRMRDDAFLALRPQSELSVEAYGERAALTLLKGALRSITGSIGERNRDHYLLKGHQVVLGIRGTDHEAFARDEGFYDRVSEGGTYLQTAKGRADIAPGQTGYAPPGGVPVVLPSTPEFALALVSPPSAVHSGPPPREHAAMDLRLPEPAAFDAPPLGGPLERPGAELTGTGVGARPTVVLPDIARPPRAAGKGRN